MIITFEIFEETYKPQKNPFVQNSSYDGCMFETYGVELAHVREQNIKNIWTLIEGENENWYIIPGFHIVNKFGYFICEVPWENEEIEVDDNKYLTQEKCVLACFEFWKDNGFEFDLNQIKNFYEKESYTVGEAKYIAMDVYTEITGQDELSSEQQDNIHDHYSSL
jgi:hypothetical protein